MKPFKSSLLLSCLIHFLLELISLIFEKFTLFLEKFLEIFLCLVWIESRALLLITSSLLLLVATPTCVTTAEGSLITTSSTRATYFSELIILFSFVFITKDLICSCDCLELICILTIVTIWVIELCETIKGVLNFGLGGCLRHFQILIVIVFRVEVRWLLSLEERSFLNCYYALP